ncbi:F0F1 ATP synthase subunit epsilon [Ruthenibacterium sp. TH_2024_36131]|uniref:ATP synthase F1 subunit epsilon n=1 Tax=Owariibacterium komagatae TaxID=3136601 RepID=UPI0038B32B9F
MSTFHLQIVTPDGGFFDGEAERVSVRTIDGEAAVLGNHIPYVTALGTGEARVVVDGQTRRAAASGGMLAVTPGHVRVVATTFEWAEDIDVERAKRAKEDAEQRIQNAKDPHELQLAKARLSRAQVRLNVAKR